MGNWFSSEKIVRTIYSIGEKVEYRDERVWRIGIITNVHKQSLSYGVKDMKGKEMASVPRENLRRIRSATLEDASHE